MVKEKLLGEVGGLFVKRYSGELENREPDRRILEWVPVDKAAEYIGDTEVDQKVLADFFICQRNQP